MKVPGLLLKIDEKLKKRLDSEQFHYEQLRGMFLPLVLDQLFIFVIGILSTAMVSSSGQEAIAAVNLVLVIGALAYALFSAISMGVSIVVARAKGSGDMDRVRAAIGQACTLIAFFSIVITVGLYVFSEPLILSLYGAADPLVIEQAVSYMEAYSLSLPPYAVFCVIFNSFRSLGDAKSSLILTIVINVIHLIFSYIFINILQLAALGSALSYLAARGVGMVFALIWLFRVNGHMYMKLKHFVRFDKSIIRETMALGVPFSFEQLLFQGGMLLVQRYIAQLTVTELAAHGIAGSMFNLYYAFSYAVTAITGTVCGQCVGAKRIDLARKYTREFVLLGRFVMLFAILIIMPVTPLVMNLYAPAPEARATIMIALAIGALPMPILWCDGYIIPAATRTAGDATFTSVISLLALFAGRLAFGYLFTITLGLGVAGVWLGQTVEWLLRMIVMRMRLRTDKWIKVPGIKAQKAL
ncbi:MAG: MATE family efflux transporter [Clostridia bacterium]|nr:MATE family efflux transporter [Clostridia bacterium]